VDGRSDLWSLGAVAFELLAGVSPFQADSGAVTVMRILSEEPPAVASVPGVPAWLAELVAQLLRKAPAERPQSAREVLSRMDRAAGTLSGTATLVQIPALPGERPKSAFWRSVARRWKFFVPAAAVAMVLVAGLFYFRRAQA